MLDRAEYVEQAYLFRSLGERMQRDMPTQELLLALKQEILASTKLPMAIDFLNAELNLTGSMGPAMKRLGHYFTPFQSFVISEAEEDRSRFDFTVAVQILEREADYRAEGATPQGLFMFQFEALCRNRLGYFKGLTAMAQDPIYDEPWREYIISIRVHVGVIDLADLIFLRSQHFRTMRLQRGEQEDQALPPVLFGEKEGQIALSNHHKDTLLLFAAMQRHLNYPLVPKPKRADDAVTAVPQLLRRVERLETRLRLVEEEQKGGIDISQFYQRPPDESEPSESGPGAGE